MSAPEPTTTSLPPRKRLHAAAAPLPTWHAARTTDHAGQPAHAVWFGSSSSPPPTATSFQIYTTTSAAPSTTDPAAAAVSAVRLLVGNDGPDQLPALRTSTPRRIDVYDAGAGMLPGDVVLACVEHQRCEIRARSGGAARIPGFAASAYEKPRGLAVLLAVRGEGVRAAEEDGPVFVWFERGRGGRVRVPGDLEVEEGGGELALERVEAEAVRIRVWDAVEGEMRRVRVDDVDEGDDESAAKAGEDEGEGGKEGGAATRPEHHLNISSEFDTAGDLYIIVDNILTETVSHNNTHLSYIFYDLSGNDNLIEVAHSFTSSLLSHIPSTTIVRLEFHRAPTLAASIERCHLELRARPDLCIGYLDNESRIFPSSPRIEAAIDKHRAHTLGGGIQMSGLSVFMVALENKNEDGVLLVRANPDLGELKQLMGRKPDDETVTVAKAVELLVGRPPGMAAVAARLAGNS